jgi:hypothetical protein
MNRSLTPASLLLTGALTIAAACGGGTRDAAPADRDPRTDSPPTGDAAAGGWRDDVAAGCDAFVSSSDAIPEPDGSAASLGAYADALRTMSEAGPQLAALDVPADVQPTLDHLVALSDAAMAALDQVDTAAAVGDVLTAEAGLNRWADDVNRIGTGLAMAGARCGADDPARLAGARLNVPLEGDSGQLTPGFGSVWVSEKLAGRVVRIDPDDGRVLATIDVGPEPLKLHAADGHMIVRTATAYVAIDPRSNQVVDTLAKADVGPAANRSWAIDGAMWICDGRRLHRYDPATFTQTAVLDLDIECGQVYATDGLVVAWDYNDDKGQSGTSAAAFVDPAGDRVIGPNAHPGDVDPRVVGTVALPVDVTQPVVLPSSVFFPANQDASTAVVVQRGTWQVTATPDLGVATAGSTTGFDGHMLYVVTADNADVLVVDPVTFEVHDTIETFGVNTVGIDGGSLSVAHGGTDLLQIYDLEDRER